jgi:type VI protein secretion system component Hcp
MPPSIYFVRLGNATIAAFKQYFSDQPSARYVGWQMIEEIAFHYQKIEWGFDEKVGTTANWPLGS